MDGTMQQEDIIESGSTSKPLRPGITAVIAAHPARLRNGLLAQAFMSVCRQTLQPAAIIVVNDIEHLGAGFTRRTILEQVQTEWMAWLDSDDYWYPNHLEKLWNVAQETGAKYVYSWFDGPSDPLGHFGKVFDPCNPHHTTITALMDVTMAKEVGYTDSAKDWPVSNEDLIFIFKMSEMACERGFKIVHLPEKTWYYRQDGQNSSGLPGKGDAR